MRKTQIQKGKENYPSLGKLDLTGFGIDFIFSFWSTYPKQGPHLCLCVLNQVYKWPCILLVDFSNLDKSSETLKYVCGLVRLRWGSIGLYNSYNCLTKQKAFCYLEIMPVHLFMYFIFGDHIQLCSWATFRSKLGVTSISFGEACGIRGLTLPSGAQLFELSSLSTLLLWK